MPKFTALREEHTFVDVQGVTVTYYTWMPGKPTAIMVLAHGVGEHALRYEHVAQFFVHKGFGVYALDQRGHGATGLKQHGGDVSRLGKLGRGGLNAVVDDLVAMLQRARAEHPGLPVGLIGHSWGSLTTQRMLNRTTGDLDAVMLSGTAYRMPGYMNSGDLNKRHAHLGSTGYEWLSRDPAVHATFADDPLTFDADVLRHFGPVEAVKLYGVPSRHIRADLPLLIAGGSDDPLGGTKSLNKLGDAYRKRAGLRDVTVTVYPGARHEIFNETNKHEVLDDTFAWFTERLLPTAQHVPDAKHAGPNPKKDAPDAR